MLAISRAQCWPGPRWEGSSKDLRQSPSLGHHKDRCGSCIRVTDKVFVTDLRDEILRDVIDRRRPSAGQRIEVVDVWDEPDTKGFDGGKI